MKHTGFLPRLGLRSLALLSGAVILLSPVGHVWADDNTASLIPQTAATAEKPVDERLASTFTVSFQDEFAKVVDEAQQYVVANKKRKAAVVLDLDETLLDNRAYYVQHKTFAWEPWHAWIIRSEAPGIPKTMEFVHWLNKKKVGVFFVSGRLESERKMTVDNLKKIGITRYDGLYLRPDAYKSGSMKSFKVSAQEEIQKKGYRLLLLLGDQESDMKSALGKGFKLPNPIYVVP